MCSQTVLNTVTNHVVVAAKDLLGEKLDKVILYGSYARGDNNAESDIDIMVIADVEISEMKDIESKLWHIGWELGYEHDVVVAIFLKDCATFNKFLSAEPFYQNVLKDGVMLSA